MWVRVRSKSLDVTATELGLEGIKHLLLSKKPEEARGKERPGRCAQPRLPLLFLIGTKLCISCSKLLLGEGLGMTSVVEFLRSMHEALGSIFSTGNKTITYRV